MDRDHDIAEFSERAGALVLTEKYDPTLPHLQQLDALNMEDPIAITAVPNVSERSG